MGDQATKIRDPIDGSRHHLRAMKAKVAAWVEETRHERSLVGPGAHRMAYSRMLDQTGAPIDASSLAEPPAEASVEAVEAMEPAPAPVERKQSPARKRPRSEARPAPRATPRTRQRLGGGRSLFTISALAAVFAAAPVGYYVLELPHEAPPVAAQATAKSAPPAKPAKIVDRLPMEAGPVPVPAVGLRTAEDQVPAQPPAQAAAAKQEPLAIAMTTMPKPPEAPPAEEVAQTASFSRPQPQPAADQPKPVPDPRAQDLFEDGKRLVGLGEVAAARPFLERAAELGHVAALVELARTYDPVALKELNVVGLKPEPDRAIALYDRARAAVGGREAASGLLGLARAEQ